MNEGSQSMSERKRLRGVIFIFERALTTHTALGPDCKIAYS